MVEDLYDSIVNDVISNVREAFLDDGVDEQTLAELKKAWLTKMKESSKGSVTVATAPTTTTVAPPTASAATNRPNQIINNNNSNTNNNIHTNNSIITTTPSNTTTTSAIRQLDGSNDTSDEDDDEENEDDYPDDELDISEDGDRETDPSENRDDEDPLNSEDDVSNGDASELFETDNVVVCQYDKISRVRNRWKFHLKDGVMNLHGKDYVFQKAVGDAEW